MSKTLNFTVTTYESTPPLRVAIERAKELYSQEYDANLCYCELTLLLTTAYWDYDGEALMCTYSFSAICR